MSFPVKIIIVGAGPAGLMAAVAAARKGVRVTVLELLHAPGRKLLASGGGKCNITNILSEARFAEAFGRQGRFILPALKLMNSQALRDFFRLRGVDTFSEDGFHFFPVSNKASDVLKALTDECKKLNVEIRPETKVNDLLFENGILTGVSTTGSVFNAGKVIIASGGKGYPALGATGIGYKLAEQAGHFIVEPVPGLVGLRTVESWPFSCKGVSFPAVSVSINFPGMKGVKSKGELLFTHRGISGPAVIDISGELNHLLRSNPEIGLSVNLFPDFTKDKWLELFSEWQKREGRKHIRNLLSRYMPHCVSDVLCGIAGGVGDVNAAEFKLVQRQKLADLLLAVPLKINGSEGFGKAMVTRGGVALKKINPDTLESRLVKGLFFAGEVLDLDGPCGGYNLQWAFSSGNLAGTSAAED
ncbi:MAG: hypothetical protein A2017_07000 [Lentisphaerae bacterium GWF2_44_16]|nr:MAG: hypothetical protein A2017_07000 [Lentisphaerae bacterium GWF2_44_16]